MGTQQHSSNTEPQAVVACDVPTASSRELSSGLVGLFVILPAAILVFAWPLQFEKGGLALPIIAAFFIGLGLMGTFNGINTYMAGKYLA